MIKIGRSVVEARKNAGLMQKQLAKKLGWSVDKVGNIERGQVDPKVSDIEKIAKALGMTVSELYGSEEAKHWRFKKGYLEARIRDKDKQILRLKQQNENLQRQDEMHYNSLAWNN